MSMKVEASEIKNDPDIEKEDYLKIYYPESSKFIEIPIYENGKLSLVDITAMDPRIVALKLINSVTEKLRKPKNGFFKEPTEKWGNFKVTAILKDFTTDDSNSHTSINTSNAKSDPDGQRCAPSETVSRSIKQESGFESNFAGNVTPSSLTTAARQVKQEPCDSTVESYVNQYQSPTVASSGAENVAVKQEPGFESNDDSNVPSPSINSQAIHVKREARVESYANQYQSPTVTSSGAEKQETISNSQSSDESLPSSSVLSNIPGSHEYDTKSFDFFTAAFIPKIRTRKYNDMKNNLIHRIIVAELMLPFEDPLLFEKFFFLHQNIKFHPRVRNFFPESYYCQNCQKNLQDVKSVVSHTFTNLHMGTALSQNELDKLIEAVSVIDYSDDGPCFKDKTVKVKKVKPPKVKKSSAKAVNRLRLPDTLNVAANGEYEFFTNQFYSKKNFNNLKRHLIHRIIQANLKLPFEDPLFIEKILFLRSNFNYRRARKMKQVFGMNDFCENCNKNFSGNFRHRLGHLLKDEHIGLSLTQDELNKLFEVLTEIHYSADGFYLTKVGCKPKKRKNDSQNSNKNVKQQRFG